VTEELFPELAGLDFGAIAAYMKRRRWRWARYGRPPTATEIEAEAQRLVRETSGQDWRYPTWREMRQGAPRYKSAVTGGLEVYLYEDGSSYACFRRPGTSKPLFEVRRAPEAGVTARKEAS
jgi:hypothetical protein